MSGSLATLERWRAYRTDSPFDGRATWRRSASTGKRVRRVTDVAKAHAVFTRCSLGNEDGMSLEDRIRKHLADAISTEPGTLQARVYGARIGFRRAIHRFHRSAPPCANGRPPDCGAGGRALRADLEARDS
jgi:hypothetical protein